MNSPAQVTGGGGDVGESQSRKSRPTAGRAASGRPAADGRTLPVADPSESLSPTARRLLAAARRVLARDGYAGLTLEAITAEAGENKAAIRYHFGGKDALITTLIEWLDHDDSVRLLDSLAAEGEDARLDLLLRLQREACRSFEENLLFFDLLPHVLRDPALRARLGDLYRWYREVDERVMAPDAAAEGGWSGRTDAHESGEASAAPYAGEGGDVGEAGDPGDVGEAGAAGGGLGAAEADGGPEAGRAGERAEAVARLAALAVAVSDGLILQSAADPAFDVDAVFAVWERLLRGALRELGAGDATVGDAGARDWRASDSAAGDAWGGDARGDAKAGDAGAGDARRVTSAGDT